MLVAAICFVILVAVSAVEQDHYKIAKEVRDGMRKVGISCADEYNVDHAIIPKIVDGTLPRDELTNKFLYCFALKLGYIKEDGHMVVDTLADIVKDHPRVEEFKKALRKCNEDSKEDRFATVAAMNACFVAAPPIRFVLD